MKSEENELSDSSHHIFHHSFALFMLCILISLPQLIPQVEESHLTPVAMWIYAPVAAE
jgi:hypothetical protein